MNTDKKLIVDLAVDDVTEADIAASGWPKLDPVWEQYYARLRALRWAARDEDLKRWRSMCLPLGRWDDHGLDATFTPPSGRTSGSDEPKSRLAEVLDYRPTDLGEDMTIDDDGLVETTRFKDGNGDTVTIRMPCSHQRESLAAWLAALAADAGVDPIGR